MQTLEYKRTTKTGRLVCFTYSECDSELVNSYTWNINSDGYAFAWINKKNVLLHRCILNLKKGEIGDHFNRDRLDNTRSNLRKVTKSVNNQNRGVRKDSRSGVRGISWQESIKKWKVQRQVNGVRHYLGVFETLKEAERALLKEL